MGISIFGNSPRENQTEIGYSSTDNNSDNKFSQTQVDQLKTELIRARKEMQESEARMAELQKKLDEFISKERQIAEVMIAAQISAQRTEAQARAKAEVLLQEADEQLRLKQQEIELLQMKAELFKQEILERLDQYKLSIEKIMNGGEDTSFTPILVAKDRKGDHKLIG